MPDSERSFADQTGKATLIKEATETFDPPFAPPDADDLPANFGTYITSCIDKNTEIGTARQDYSNGAKERLDMVKDLKNRAMRSMTNVESVDAYESFAKGLKITYRKLRNYKVPGAKKPDPNAKKRNKGEQSFADIENLYKTFLAGLSAIPGYTHLDAELQLPALNTLYTNFHDKNVAMAELGAEENRLTAERYDMFYNTETGLKARMLSVKNAVKNQYGPESPEYLSIKGIRV